MDRAVDEILKEVQELENQYIELKQQAEANTKWANQLWRALKLSCERTAVAADANFFDQKKAERIRTVHNIMQGYIDKAKEEEYHGRHSD